MNELPLLNSVADQVKDVLTVKQQNSTINIAKLIGKLLATEYISININKNESEKKEDTHEQ